MGVKAGVILAALPPLHLESGAVGKPAPVWLGEHGSQAIEATHSLLLFPRVL